MKMLQPRPASVMGRASSEGCVRMMFLTTSYACHSHQTGTAERPHQNNRQRTHLVVNAATQRACDISTLGNVYMKPPAIN
eukprot:1189415-Prorocentrum_minimum.AAC.2